MNNESEEVYDDVSGATCIDVDAVNELAKQGDSYISNDIHQVQKAIDLFLNSDFSNAELFLKTQYCKSLYYTFGYGTILFLKSIMTFDPADIHDCSIALENSVQLASILRKPQGFISSISGYFTGKGSKEVAHLKIMSKLERHAELVYAESFLIKAQLSLVTDKNMVAFIREGLKIRASYSIYKNMYRFLRKVYKEDGEDGFKKYNIDEHFVSGVLFGNGAFNMILSMMPSKLLKLFEFIGFSGNRQFSMSCLETGAKWPKRDTTMCYPEPKKDIPKDKILVPFKLPDGVSGNRAFLCDLCLLVYHIVFSSMIQLPDSNMPLAGKMVDMQLKKYPESFIFLGLKARLEQSKCNPMLAEAEYIKVIENQLDWRNLTHVCYWDLGFCQAAQGKWKEAAQSFQVLLAESKWSAAIYAYLQASFLYHADKEKYADKILELMDSVPNLTRKIAGKSVPFEKFVSRKARKFKSQNNRLLLPGYEVIYMWTGFDIIPLSHMNTVLSEISNHLTDLDSQLENFQKTGKNADLIPYETFNDDIALARFLKGIAIRELNYPTSNTIIPANELVSIKPTTTQISQLTLSSKQLSFITAVADQIVFDHWILPYSRFELGQIYMRLGNYKLARKEFKAAKNGGYTDKETGILRKRYSMENSLHLKTHNCLVKLTVLEILAGLTVEDSEDEEIVEEVSARVKEMPSLIASSFLILITLYAYKKSHKFKFLIKTVLYFVGLGISSIAGISVSPLFYLLGSGIHCNYIVGKITKVLIPILTGIKVNVKGREHFNIDRPCVFIANHQSRLDLAVLAETITPGTIVIVKESLKYYPILGQYLMIAKNVFITRSNSQSAVDTMKRVVKTLVKDKTSLYMYPEGTRSHQKTNTMLPFKKGAFHLAVQGQIPIIPIVISTYDPYYSEENLVWDDLQIQVQVLPPIETVGLTVDNVDDLTESTRKLMIDTLATLSTKPLGNSAAISCLNPVDKKNE